MVGLETEMGYFSLAEMRDIRGPGGLRIERDLWFEPTPVRELADYEAVKSTPEIERALNQEWQTEESGAGIEKTEPNSVN